MTTIPTVSVVIPCFRQGHFLPMAIDSVLNQSYPNVEPIVVNDGSDDDTKDVAASYGGRIRYLEKTNEGLATARNAGVAEAHGRYLLCLDADDMLHPNAVEWLVGGMARRDDRLVVMGWRDFSEDPARDAQAPRPHEHPTFSLAEMVAYNPAPPNCYLSATRAVREVGGFEQTVAPCADWDLWIRLMLAGARAHTIPHVGAYYRHHPASMSADLSHMMEARTLVLLRAHRAIIQRPDVVCEMGNELYATEKRVLRRLLAMRDHKRLAAEVGASMQQLARRGFSQQREGRWPKRLLDVLLGWRSEKVAIRWLRFVRPREIPPYVNEMW